MMSNLRPIQRLERVGKCPSPGPSPEFVYLTLDQLFVNDDYQRELTGASQKRIRKMASLWDWCSYKAISVAATEDPNVYEVVDGQHTAIAARTNGNVQVLPCLLMSAQTLQEKAKGFLGINQDKVALSKAAIYNAKIAAEDPVAIALQVALEATGCRVLSFPPPNGAYRQGDVLAIGTLQAIAQARGGLRLQRLLAIGKSGGGAPVSSCLLKALDLALPRDGKGEAGEAIATVLRGQGVARLEMMATSRTPHGKRAYETLADLLAEMARLPEKRMGRNAAAARGRPPRLPVAA